MKVTVTEKHIADGRFKDSHHCMIADAIKDAVPAAQFILVDLQSIRYSDPKTRTRYKYLTPATAQQNLLRFDKGDRKIQPFTFSLTGPITRSMDPARTETQAEAKTRKARKRTKAHLKKYAYLAANRAARPSREREFGLRKFVA